MKGVLIGGVAEKVLGVVRSVKGQATAEPSICEITGAAEAETVRP